MTIEEMKKLINDKESIIYKLSELESENKYLHLLSAEKDKEITRLMELLKEVK